MRCGGANQSPITECIAGAVQNRLVRLKRKAEADMSGAVSASPMADGTETAAGTVEANGGAGEISTGSPKKRKAAPRKQKGDETPKKVKTEDEDEDML